MNRDADRGDRSGCDDPIPVLRSDPAEAGVIFRTSASPSPRSRKKCTAPLSAASPETAEAKTVEFDATARNHQPASTSRRGGLSFDDHRIDHTPSRTRRLPTRDNRRRVHDAFLRPGGGFRQNLGGSIPFTGFHPDDDQAAALGSTPRAAPHRASRRRISTPPRGPGQLAAEPDAAERLPTGTASARHWYRGGFRGNHAVRRNRSQKQHRTPGSGISKKS